MRISEAIDVIATEARAFARRHGLPASRITLLFIAERVTELHRDESLKGEAARRLYQNGARQRKALALALREF